MRKFWIVLLIVALLMPAALANASEGEQKTGDQTNQGEATHIDLIKSKALVHASGDGSFTQTEENTIIANNLGKSNRALMSEIFVQPGSYVSIYLKAIIKQGSAVGITIGESDFLDPFKTGYLCLNADTVYKTSRLYAYHGPGAKVLGDGKATFEDQNLAEGQEVVLRLEIDPDGTFWTYYNGLEYSRGKVRYEDFAGGYVGIMTYDSDAEFLSAKLSINQVASFLPTPTSEEGEIVVNLNGLKLLERTAGEGTFVYTEDNHILAENLKIGDTALMSKIFLEPGKNYSVSVSAILKEGQAFGIVIGEKAYTNPFKTGWICVNIDTKIKTSRVFAYNGPAAKVIKGKKLFVDVPDTVHGQTVSLQLDISQDGYFHAYYNGTEYTKGEMHYPDFGGGYVGIMTYKGNVEFLSATITGTATKGN